MCTLSWLPLSLFGLSCPNFCGDVGLGYDYFRSIPDGDWEGNTGGFTSFNIATSLPCYDLGYQFGGSYGLYDWSGKNSAPSNKQTKLQQQLFITTALFKMTPCESGFNYGMAYDWMWNKGFGVFGAQTSFSQLRFQGGYLCRQCNEFGLWGTLDLHRSHRSSQDIPLTFRAISQINAYWKHLFANCSETMFWVGLPYKRSLSFATGRAGKFIIGASFHAPLCNRLSIDGHASYMVPHSAEGALKQRFYAANICLELKYTFGDQCSCYCPYMPIANNSNFLSDTNVTF